MSWIKLGLGVVFLLLAARQWARRPEPDEDPPLPAWMQTIGTFTAGRALGLGVLLSGVNPRTSPWRSPRRHRSPRQGS